MPEPDAWDFDFLPSGLQAELDRISAAYDSLHYDIRLGIPKPDALKRLAFIQNATDFWPSRYGTSLDEGFIADIAVATRNAGRYVVETAYRDWHTPRTVVYTDIDARGRRKRTETTFTYAQLVLQTPGGRDRLFDQSIDAVVMEQLFADKEKTILEELRAKAVEDAGFAKSGVDELVASIDQGPSRKGFRAFLGAFAGAALGVGVLVPLQLLMDGSVDLPQYFATAFGGAGYGALLGASEVQTFTEATKYLIKRF